LDVAQVFDLAAKIEEPFGLMVLVATFGSLRWGEVTALRRRDFSSKTGTVVVERAYYERSTGELLIGAPKSRAGVRSIALPRPVADLLAAAEDGAPDDLIFTTARGRPLRRSNFNRQSGWTDAVKAINMPGLHFHDLRHTGNTLAAESGASLRDLMARMGHDSMQAALIYQHRTRGADRRIAAALEALIEGTKRDGDDPDDGAAGALVPAG
jgi:integrase